MHAVVLIVLVAVFPYFVLLTEIELITYMAVHASGVEQTHLSLIHLILVFGILLGTYLIQGHPQFIVV